MCVCVCVCVCVWGKNTSYRREMKEEKKRREGGKKMDKKAIIKPDAHPRKEQQRHAEEANERP